MRSSCDIISAPGCPGRVASIFLLLFLFLCSLAPTLSSAREQKWVQMHATVIEVAGKKRMAVSLKVTPGWHIYWKNPGEAGRPPQFLWFKGKANIPMKPLEWPAPKKYMGEGGVFAYGHGEIVSFFFDFSDQALREFPGAQVILEGKWIVCSDICVPGEDELVLKFDPDLSAVSSSPQYYALDQKQLLQAFRQLPQPADWPSNLEMYLGQVSSEQLVLHFSLDRKLLRSSHGTDNVLLPFPHPFFDFKQEQLFEDGQGKVFGKFTLDWNGQYLTPTVEMPRDGVFRPPLQLQFLFFDLKTQKREVISTTLSGLSPEGDSIGRFYQSLRPFGQKQIPSQAKASPNNSLFFFLLLAFVGGIILNFMPCVLPVVSLKLFSLIKNKEASRTQLFRHNIAYTAGVVASFMGLALAVVALKLGGESVGWGFQLQSPLFVAVMIVALMLFACNLFGLFEFSLPWGSFPGMKSSKQGLMADFSSGVLATILSTPCSAPFLGTALTFAFTSSVSMVFLVFLFIGLGLSAPFLLTALFPRSLALLPRPGKWMDDLKKFLGLTLLLTIVWLYDVFLSLVSENHLVLILNLVLITLFFALYFHHRMGRGKWMKLVFYAVPVLILLGLLQGGPTMGGKQQSPLELNWRPWSEQAMQQLRGQWVFIDFTAQWCFTCKVNEKLVLNTSGFRHLVQSRGVALLLADWTKRDAAIADFLKRHGYAGVPVYFVQRPDGKLISLGETINLAEIEQALQDPR